MILVKCGDIRGQMPIGLEHSGSFKIVDAGTVIVTEVIDSTDEMQRVKLLTHLI